MRRRVLGASLKALCLLKVVQCYYLLFAALNWARLRRLICITAALISAMRCGSRPRCIFVRSYNDESLFNVHRCLALETANRRQTRVFRAETFTGVVIRLKNGPLHQVVYPI